MPQPSTARYALIIAILALCGLLAVQSFRRGGSSQSKQEIIDNFHKLTYDSWSWNNMRWLGVQALQNPNDAWIHQEIIVEVKPDFIIETGTAKGGSAALWATILQQVNPDARVITIDIKDEAAEAKKLPIVKQYVEFWIGSSTDPEIISKVTKRVQGRKVLIILDSDHSRDHVLAEMKAYAPLVSVGSYMIVQDTNLNGHPVYATFGPGPMEAVQEFLASNKQFESDANAERLMLTYHPKGYLKRRH